MARFAFGHRGGCHHRFQTSGLFYLLRPAQYGNIVLVLVLSAWFQGPGASRCLNPASIFVGMPEMCPCVFLSWAVSSAQTSGHGQNVFLSPPRVSPLAKILPDTCCEAAPRT
eukprot:3204722-Rhodomonas_salina.1